MTAAAADALRAELARLDAARPTTGAFAAGRAERRARILEALSGPVEPAEERPDPALERALRRAGGGDQWDRGARGRR